MSTEALQKAICEIGTQGRLAALLGKQQGHVGKWLHRDKKVPADMCLAIERVTGGKVTRYELRPDVFGDPPSKGTRRKA